MRRPVFANTLIGLQVFVAVLGLTVSIYVAWLTRSPDILKEKEAPEIVRGLWIGAAATGLPALVEGVIAIGLLRRKRWAWWTGAISNAVLTAVFIYSAFDQHGVDADDVAIVMVTVLLCVLYFGPGVRQWFLGKRELAPAATA